MSKKLIGLIILCLFFYNLKAQNSFVDSLKIEIENTTNDSLKIQYLNLIAWNLMRKDPDESLNYIQKAEKIAKKRNNDVEIAACLNLYGVIEKNKANYSKALQLYKESLKLHIKAEWKIGESASYNNIGTIYLYKGEYDKALEYYLKGLVINEEIFDSAAIAKSLMNIGNIYYYQENQEKALDYFKRSLFIKIKIKVDPLLIANSLNNIAVIYENLSTDSSLTYYGKAIEIYENEKEVLTLSSTYLNIASLYAKKDIEKAKYYITKAILMKEELNDKDALAIGYLEYGNILLKENNNIEAEKYYLKAREVAIEIGNKQSAMTCNKNLHSFYELNKNYEKSLKYLKEYNLYKDSIFTEEKSLQLADVQEKYETEKKDKEIVLLTKDNELKSLKITQQQSELLFSILVGLLLLLLIFVSIYFIRKNRAINKIIIFKNEELNQTNEEVLAQRDEIERQKNIVDKQNSDIFSSIEYAKRIQQAILPSDLKLVKNLPNSFVFYLPKDIVSGDFYWLEVVGDKVFFAVVDCTGHGVPGAFMSIVGANGLKKIVLDNSILKPSEILENLTAYVIDSMADSKDGREIMDGMDIALCCWDKSTNILEYAGAYNPLYLIRNNELIITKATKRPIGRYMSKTIKPFENHQIQLHINDSIFIFSDGYADQFGGENGGKYSYSRLKELLLNMHKQDCNRQKNILETEFYNWKNQESQLDDVCILGVKI